MFPFILGLGNSNPFALQLSVATGVAAFVLTLLTDKRVGAIKVISYKLHLAVDFMVAIVFLIVAFALLFEGIDAYYYWINGVAILTVVSLHKSGVAI